MSDRVDAIREKLYREEGGSIFAVLDGASVPGLRQKLADQEPEHIKTEAIVPGRAGLIQQWLRAQMIEELGAGHGISGRAAAFRQQLVHGGCAAPAHPRRAATADAPGDSAASRTTRGGRGDDQAAEANGADSSVTASTSLIVIAPILVIRS